MSAHTTQPQPTTLRLIKRTTQLHQQTMRKKPKQNTHIHLTMANQAKARNKRLQTQQHTTKPTTAKPNTATNQQNKKTITYLINNK